MIDELIYRSYCWNRCISPEVSPERWGILFANWQAMEERYQADAAMQEAQP